MPNSLLSCRLDIPFLAVRKERGGKVKAMVINRTNKTTLQGKIHSNIQVKSTVVTDDFRGYLGLKEFP
jgi:hypothetical protein